MMEGFRLMVAGMGTVFAFLIILVWAMNAAAWFFERYTSFFPEPVVPAAKNKISRQLENHVDIAVAIAAVKAFSNK